MSDVTDLAGATAGPAPCAAARPLKAVQQFMLASVLRSEGDAARVLERVRAVGYDAIELNAFMTSGTPLVVRALTRLAGMPVGRGGSFDWPRLLLGACLVASAYHVDLGSLERDAGAVVEAAHALGTSELVITALYRFDYADAGAVRSLARRLDAAGRAVAERGSRLSYHNHNAEFLRVEGERSAYDLLLDETDPGLVSFELDTYWAAEAGMDTVRLMRRVAAGGRLSAWHVSDRRPQVPRRGMLTPMLTSDACELGHGCLPLDTLMGEALAGGVRSVVLETHRNWTGGSPVRSLEESAHFLNERIGGA